MTNITASSSEHQGIRVVTVQRSPGDYYMIMDVTHEVTVNCNGSFSVAITFRVELKLNTVPCLNQRLETQTHLQDDHNNLFNHSEQLITSVGAVSYSVSNGIARKHHYIGIISIINSDNVPVGSMSVTFSTYDIQHCDVYSDNTSILVECTFALSSTTPGFVLLQDEQSKHNINRTLQRLGLSGLVNISGLPAGEYSVTVFDQEEDYVDNNPAFEHAEYLKIFAFHDEERESTHLKASPTLIITEPSPDIDQATMYITPSPEQSSSPAHNNQAIILTAAVTSSGSLILISMLLFTLITLIICSQRRKKGKIEADHVPVNNNPAYMIAQRIDLSNNVAYATTTSLQHTDTDYECIVFDH